MAKSFLDSLMDLLGLKSSSPARKTTKSKAVAKKKVVKSKAKKVVGKKTKSRRR